MAELKWRRSVGEIEVVKLSVGGMDNNVFVLSSGGESILIDGADEAAAILDEVGTRKLTRILQTHGHQDHVQALKELVEKTKAPVFVHQEDQAMIPVPTELISESDTVTLGKTALNVIHTPGHTPGSVGFVLREDGQVLVFAGDTLFPGGPGGTQKPEQFIQIMSSLDRKLFVLDDDAEILPGHGPDTTIGDERPFVEEWRARGW